MSGAIPSLIPALPEIILAVGAMALLMVGAYGGERTNLRSASASIALLVVACIAVVLLPSGKLATFGGSFVVDDFARFVKILAFGGTAAAILMSFDFVKRAGMRKFEYPMLMLLVGRRHGHADLGDRPDRALSRPRTDEPVALRDRGHRPRFREIDRGRAEIFRPRRAVVRHAALRRLADLRRDRQHHLCRHRAGRAAGRARADLRPRVPAGRALLQGLGGAVPHVDAGRL